MAKVLVISDTQAPFHHPQSIRFLRATYKKHRCNAVVHIGDEIDNKFLKYGTVDDNHTANEQHRLAKKFIHKLADAFPRVMVCHSDDYHALAVISTICDPNISKKILRRVRSRFWYQNNTPQWDWRSFFFFYQHQLIAIHKVASGKGLSWMDKQWIKLVIAHTDSQQDSRKLTSMLRFVVGGIDKDLDRRFKKWEDAYRNEQPLGLGETLHEYYNKRPDEEVHPNRYWLRQYFGRRK